MSGVYGHCDQCGKTVPLTYEDASFDYAATHQGPADTHKDYYWGCDECNTICEPYCEPDKDYDPEFDDEV